MAHTITETGAPDKKRPDFVMSVDTRLIYERLQQASVGETISYDELNELIGRNVRNGAASPFYSARRRAENMDGIVFGTVTNVGIKRLTDAEIVEAGEGDMNRVRRAARRGMKRLACSEFDALDADHKVKHNTFASVLGALTTVTKPSAVKRVEEKVSQSQQSLPLAATLEAFKG